MWWHENVTLLLFCWSQSVVKCSSALQKDSMIEMMCGWLAPFSHGAYSQFVLSGGFVVVPWVTASPQRSIPVAKKSIPDSQRGRSGRGLLLKLSDKLPLPALTCCISSAVHPSLSPSPALSIRGLVWSSTSTSMPTPPCWMASCTAMCSRTRSVSRDRLCSPDCCAKMLQTSPL